ncbi:MAG: hypothetical protein ACFFCW_42860, partial [Candidatus Hodarchaeota archaeon]
RFCQDFSIFNLSLLKRNIIRLIHYRHQEFRNNTLLSLLLSMLVMLENHLRPPPVLSEDISY